MRASFVKKEAQSGHTVYGVLQKQILLKLTQPTKYPALSSLNNERLIVLNPLFYILTISKNLGTVPILWY